MSSFTLCEKQGPHGSLLVVTDSELIGKCFNQGRLQLDLRQEFYKGTEASADQVRKLMERARHVHLTGKRAVKLGLELKIIDPERVLVVDNIPHAQSVK